MNARAKALLGALAAAAIGVASIPKPALIPDDGAGSVAFYDVHGRLLRLTLGRDQEYRLWVPLKDLSPALVEATLLQEDRHFRAHPGVNPFSLARAAWSTYIRRTRRVGGSTITMQLARIRFRIDTKRPIGKAEQILRALQLERWYSKDQILEAYLNCAPYGGNVEGAGAASLIWFGRSPSELTLAEALTLAVIPQNPVKRGRADDALDAARAALFARWVERHPADRDKEVDLAQVRLRREEQLPFLAPHFVDGELARGGVPATDGRVVTTLDLELQRLLERSIAHFVDAQKPLGVRNATALLVDRRDMSVRALVGSADWFDATIDGQVDGTLARRSPGSTLKPFLYALAFEQGVVHPHTMLKDSPLHFADYSPENADGAFEGPIDVHDALIRSRNVPAVDVASRLAPGRGLYDLLRRAGVGGLRDEEFYGLALVLGGAEVTMRDEARLYAALGSGGRLRALRTRESDPVDAGAQLLSPEAAFLSASILADNPEPGRALTGAWERAPVTVAWKTGTSHGFRDAWSVGLVGPYVLVVWVGNFDGEGNPAFVGAKAAAPLFFSIVDALRARPETRAVETVSPPAKANLARVEVCALSGGLPQPWCPHRKTTWFIPGVSPITMCDLHRRVAVDVASGRRVCGPRAAAAKQEVFEYWPSDLLQLFRLAGLPRRAPPPDDDSCAADRLAEGGLQPTITSPRAGVEYAVHVGDAGDDIELSAVADADVDRVYWFLDAALLGSSRSGETLSWHPRTGRFVVRAVDDHGRAASRDVVVAGIE